MGKSKKRSGYMTLKGGAAYAHMSYPSFKKLTQNGLRVAKIGNRTYRVKAEWIDEYMDNHIDEGAKTIAANIIAEMS